MTPIYNENNLPCVQSPIKIRKEQTKKYLGGYAQVGQTFVDIELAATTMSEVAALYFFWAVDCAGGTNPFLINLPINGNFDNYLCSWVSDLNNITNSNYGNISVTIKVLCKNSEFTQDEDGTYHIKSTGETVYSNTLLKAEDFKGIVSITKTGTNGLVDTYTILYTNGSTSTFNVTNGAGAVDSVNGLTGVVVLDKTHIGLSNVDNTADNVKNVLSATKLTTSRTITLTGDVTGSVSFDGTSNVNITTAIEDDSHSHSISNVNGLQGALNSKAPINSPAFTGVPTAPTPSSDSNSTQIATTGFVKAVTSTTASYISPWFDVTYNTEYPITHNLGSDNVRITVEAKIVSNPSSYTAIGEIFVVGEMTNAYDNNVRLIGVVKKVVDVNTVKIIPSNVQGNSLGYVYSGVNNENVYLNWTNSTANGNVNHCQIRVKVEKIGD